MARCKPVKLAYHLFEPKCGAEDRLSPLIFLHGLTFSKESTWGDLPQVFADQTKRKAYSVDARNHGDSEWSDEFDMDLNVVDFLHFIDEMNFPKVVVVGHSMGGFTGIRAALRAPERIEMLFVEDNYVRKMPQAVLDLSFKTHRFWRDAEKLIPPEMNKEDADKFVNQYIFQKTQPEDKRLKSRPNNTSYPLVKDSSGRYVFKVNLEVILEKMKNMDEKTTENEGIYEGPSCFLYANNSFLKVGKEKNHILKHFPNAVFVPFETSAHMFHKKFQDLFVETIVKFIKHNEENSDSSLS